MPIPASVDDLTPDGLQGPLIGFFDPVRSEQSQYISEDFSFCERWVKLCGGEVSIPPLAVPPLSCSVIVIVAVPLRLAAGV